VFNPWICDSLDLSVIFFQSFLAAIHYFPYKGDLGKTTGELSFPIHTLSRKQGEAFTMTIKILLITPPFTQLNTPYPATPY